MPLIIRRTTRGLLLFFFNPSLNMKRHKTSECNIYSFMHLPIRRKQVYSIKCIGMTCVQTFLKNKKIKKKHGFYKSSLKYIHYSTNIFLPSIYYVTNVNVELTHAVMHETSNVTSIFKRVVIFSYWTILMYLSMFRISMELQDYDYCVIN